MHYMTFEKVCLFVQNKLSSIQIDAVSIGPQNWAIPLINRNNITHNKANNYTLKSFRIYHTREWYWSAGLEVDSKYYSPLLW